MKLEKELEFHLDMENTIDILRVGQVTKNGILRNEYEIALASSCDLISVAARLNLAQLSDLRDWCNERLSD